MVKNNTRDYINLLDKLSSNNIIGGASYDGLMLEATNQIKVNKVLTLNVSDFIRISPELAQIISEP